MTEETKAATVFAVLAIGQTVQAGGRTLQAVQNNNPTELAQDEAK